MSEAELFPAPSVSSDVGQGPRSSSPSSRWSVKLRLLAQLIFRMHVTAALPFTGHGGGELRSRSSV